MKRTAIFVDHENLSIAARNRGVGIDWFMFKDYLANDSEGRFPVEAFCYVAVDPRNEHAKDHEIERLWEDGWLVKQKVGAPAGVDHYKCNVDVEMAMDMVSFAYDAKPDIVVLVSGDQDFAPVARKLREKGVRVEVASFPENLSRVLLNAASGYINLETWATEKNDASESDVIEASQEGKDGGYAFKDTLRKESFQNDEVENQDEGEVESENHFRCFSENRMPSSGKYSAKADDDEF